MVEFVPWGGEDRIRKMNSRERVLAAIDRVEPDRVPLDLWALPPVTENLRAHLVLEQDDETWRALGIDLRSVWPAYQGPALPTFEDGSWTDWWGLHKRMMGPFEEVVEPPLAAAQTAADVEAYSWPDPDWFDYTGMRPECEALRGYALVVRDPGPHATCVLRVAMFLRGMG
jgi:uroporphyrinogen decarboxylase